MRILQILLVCVLVSGCSTTKKTRKPRIPNLPPVPSIGMLKTRPERVFSSSISTNSRPKGPRISGTNLYLNFTFSGSNSKIPVPLTYPSSCGVSSDGRTAILYWTNSLSKFRIEASTNLLDWETIGRGVSENTNLFQVFIDQGSGTIHPFRFYRRIQE